MPDPKPFSSNRDPRYLPPAPSPETRKQQRLMIVALTLLLVALGFVLYRDRDFWFPNTEESESQPTQTVVPGPAAGQRAEARPTRPVLTARTRAHARNAQPKTSPPAADVPVPPATITRTVLPPLEVEVVAGSAHQNLQPGTNAVHVDLEPASPSVEASGPPVTDINQTAATVTSNTAERTQMFADTASIVTHSVRPGYPMLARQMKVQGSVILQALIGRDGLIQDLRVLSGPPILATAAQEAVKQWHFKPHYEGSDAVETQARITVNFTISTN